MASYSASPESLDLTFCLRRTGTFLISPYQQNLQSRKIAIVVLGRNRWSLIQPMLQEIVAAVNAAKPGSYTLVEIPGE